MKDRQADADLSFMERKSLEQICFGTYQLQLNFSESVSLNLESRLVLTTAENEVFDLRQPYTQADPLLNLLGSEVISAWAEANGDLSVEFSNNDTLKIMNDNAEFESYQIMNGSSSIIV